MVLYVSIDISNRSSARSVIYSFQVFGSRPQFFGSFGRALERVRQRRRRSLVRAFLGVRGRGAFGLLFCILGRIEGVGALFGRKTLD